MATTLALPSPFAARIGPIETVFIQGIFCAYVLVKRQDLDVEVILKIVGHRGSGRKRD